MTISPSEPMSIDGLLSKQRVFCIRTTNALMRQSIITLRLLLEHTPELLVATVSNLGLKGLAEIEHVLECHDLCFTTEARIEDLLLTRLLVKAYRYPPGRKTLELEELANQVYVFGQRNQYVQVTWGMEDVARGAIAHPYLHETEKGNFTFEICSPNVVPVLQLPHSAASLVVHLDSQDLPVDSFPETSPDPTGVPNCLSDGKGIEVEKQDLLNLSEIWTAWFGHLNKRQQVVIVLLYGIEGDEPYTLQEAGDELGVSRERVRQIKEKALKRLRWMDWSSWKPMEEAFARCVRDYRGLLRPWECEQWLDDHATWDEMEPRPVLSRLLCDVFSEYQYLRRYDVATVTAVSTKNLESLESALKRILRQPQCRETGLTADELVVEAQAVVQSELPAEMGEKTFILKAVDLFDHIGLQENDRYHYLRKKKEPLYPRVDSDWAGNPGSSLFDWEKRLRKQFEVVDWIGQLALTETEFAELCQSIQNEAQDPNYFSKVVEGQPRLVPPAVFMTTMVFSARYVDHLSDEAVDEFWTPYLRAVWNTEYSQAFYVRCKKRFDSVADYLENTFGFTFPRTGQTRDIVTPVFRHALIPRYMQTDFAMWLRENWRSILVTADTPIQLAARLRNEPSLDHGGYSHRLKHFIVGNSTCEAAAALITNMAAAVDLHVNDGESLEDIHALLADSPIEQELWQELSLIFSSKETVRSTIARTNEPRLSWVWSLDENELTLRIQDIVLLADEDIEGEPDRLVWLGLEDCDDTHADIEIAVTPWRMKTGERLIPDTFIGEPEGPQNGRLLLLTDMDETALRMDIPLQPTAAIQFFRITQQGAYGIPVDVGQVRDGTYLVCAAQNMMFYEQDGDEATEIELDRELLVPYPLDARYGWAAQITLSSPTLAIHQGTRIDLLQRRDRATPSKAWLEGERPIQGLSRQVQPTFSNTRISLHFDNISGELPKQTVLWLHGQDGWRWHQSISLLAGEGHISRTENELQIDLQTYLPNTPNFYTVVLRSSLQPILEPLQFAVVPEMDVEATSDELIHTPATPFKVSLSGVNSSSIARSRLLSVEMLSDSDQQVTWHDYRTDPRLLLRFDKVEIPLAWSISRFMVWLEPEPSRRFSTLQEMRQTTLNAVGKQTEIDTFGLFLTNQSSRRFHLKRGRFRIQLGHSQLLDSVKMSQQQVNTVHVQIGSATWPILEVRSHPNLSHATVNYDSDKQVVLVNTGLAEEWTGDARFVAQSLTNPFAPRVTLGRTSSLTDLHEFSFHLTDGAYLLQIELDGALLALDESQTRFATSASFDLFENNAELVNEVRTGSLISLDSAQDFLLLWAELASTGDIKLSPTSLYQLSTIPTQALENFTSLHLAELWPPLVVLKEVSQNLDWADEHGLLPSWILFPWSLMLKTPDHGFRLRVYPIQVLERGYRGTGYGRWRISPYGHASKDFVYVQWRPISESMVQIEAGLPLEVPADWSNVDLLDTYGLYYCLRCGRFTGARDVPLPADVQEAHRHGHDQIELYDINTPEEYGGHRAIMEPYPEIHSEGLLEVFQRFDVPIDSAANYLPEPNAREALSNALFEEQLAIILRGVMWHGGSSREESPWASADRLLSLWGHQECVSRFGQSVVGLSLLLRSAAHDPLVYRRILKRVALSEDDIRSLLAAVVEMSPLHVEWSLTWAELLIQHSPGSLE